MSDGGSGGKSTGEEAENPKALGSREVEGMVVQIAGSRNLEFWSSQW